MNQGSQGICDDAMCRAGWGVVSASEKDLIEWKNEVVLASLYPVRE